MPPYTTAAIGESRAPPALPAARRARPAAALPYFAGVSTTDPLAAPASSPEVLAKFPPTLIVTGTRAFELSSAVYTHALLIKYGRRSRSARLGRHVPRLFLQRGRS